MNLKPYLSAPEPQDYKDGWREGASVSSRGLFTCTALSQTNPLSLPAVTQFSRKVNMTIFKDILNKTMSVKASSPYVPHSSTAYEEKYPSQ